MNQTDQPQFVQRKTEVLPPLSITPFPLLYPLSQNNVANFCLAKRPVYRSVQCPCTRFFFIRKLVIVLELDFLKIFDKF